MPANRDEFFAKLAPLDAEQRVTFRRLATEAQSALHATDSGPAEEAMELMIDLACHADGGFRSDDPQEAAKFVVMIIGAGPEPQRPQRVGRELPDEPIVVMKHAGHEAIGMGHGAGQTEGELRNPFRFRNQDAILVVCWRIWTRAKLMMRQCARLKLSSRPSVRNGSEIAKNFGSCDSSALAFYLS